MLSPQLLLASQLDPGFLTLPNNFIFKDRIQFIFQTNTSGAPSGDGRHSKGTPSLRPILHPICSDAKFCISNTFYFREIKNSYPQHSETKDLILAKRTVWNYAWGGWVMKKSVLMQQVVMALTTKLALLEPGDSPKGTSNDGKLHVLLACFHTGLSSY